MVTSSSRTLSLYFVPILVPLAFPALVPYSIQTNESPLNDVFDPAYGFHPRPGIGKRTL